MESAEEQLARTMAGGDTTDIIIAGGSPERIDTQIKSFAKQGYRVVRHWGTTRGMGKTGKGRWLWTHDAYKAAAVRGVLLLTDCCSHGEDREAVRLAEDYAVRLVRGTRRTATAVPMMIAAGINPGAVPQQEAKMGKGARTRTRQRPWSDEEKQRVASMRLAGIKWPEIAEITGATKPESLRRVYRDWARKAGGEAALAGGTLYLGLMTPPAAAEVPAKAVKSVPPPQVAPKVVKAVETPREGADRTLLDEYDAALTAAQSEVKSLKAQLAAETARAEAAESEERRVWKTAAIKADKAYAAAALADAHAKAVKSVGGAAIEQAFAAGVKAERAGVADLFETMITLLRKESL